MDEERIALGHLVHGGGEPIRRWPTADAVDEAPVSARLNPRNDSRSQLASRASAPSSAASGCPRPQLDVAIGGDHDQARAVRSRRRGSAAVAAMPRPPSADRRARARAAGCGWPLRGRSSTLSNKRKRACGRLRPPARRADRGHRSRPAPGRARRSRPAYGCFTSPARRRIVFPTQARRICTHGQNAGAPSPS